MKEARHLLKGSSSCIALRNGFFDTSEAFLRLSKRHGMYLETFPCPVLPKPWGWFAPG
jgi:hypothetical protein